MNKKSALRLARIVGTLLLIVYVLYNANLFTAAGWRNLFGTFAQTNVPYLLVSLAIGFVNMFASALKWYMLVRSRKIEVSLWRLYAYYIIGMFFNLILPTSMGGDVVRVNELGRYTRRYADAVASVFVERFTGLATLALLALVAVLLNLRLFNLPWLTWGLGLMVCGILGVVWLIVDEQPFRLARRIAGSRLSILQNLFAKIEKFQQAVLAYRDTPGALVIAFINSVIFYLLAVINVWVSAKAFGSDLTFLDMLVAVPIILLIMNLPISIGGIGLMEFAYSFTLQLFGASSALAISTALLLRAKSFLYAGVGGLLYMALSDGYTMAGQVANEGSD